MQPTSEPMSRGIVHHAVRQAAEDQWGRSVLTRIAERLPADARRATIDQSPDLLSWLPTSYLMAWYEAVLQGPCQAQDEIFRSYIDRMMDLGFGRVRKLLLSFVTPQGLIERAADLWRHDHSHGTLDVTSSDRRAVATLRAHPFVHEDASRRAIAESYRYALSLSRAQNVRETHAPDGRGNLVVHLTWSG